MARDNRFATFYVDDSSCNIAGSKHFILAAVTYEYEDRTLKEWIEQKAKCGLPPYEEVRWNSKNIPIARRREFVPIANSGTGLVVLDGYSKQQAALILAQQVWRYCDEVSAAAFRLRFDENIISDWRQLKGHLRGFYPPCTGLCEADSGYEHLLQAADFLAGAVKLAMDFGLGQRNPNEQIILTPELSEASGLSQDEGCELGWFMFANLRYCIWGEVSVVGEAPGEPWKTTTGRGLVYHSPLPGTDIEPALSSLDGFFMGCIH